MTKTELEKQINKILLKASFLDSNGSLGICQSYFKNVTKEIASLKMEGMYERELLMKFRNYFNTECYGSIEEWIIDEYLKQKP